ncbi:MAG: hypothetical protein JXR46_13620 [Calditrichaceae bacterium]|nr:hypothetical protein [Calditrichaceae bacterium]MBN2710074.1 hypothetical protein [Calditrichaceae bacterium]RQV94510.1 MAG: hypothetical protein EH224_10220 [Calditrichota bacterium]
MKRESQVWALKFIFNISFICIILAGCEDLKRDNLLDPKNEDSYTSGVVLVEAFVNLDHPTDYNKWAVQGLNQISANYKDKILIVQYHRNIKDYPDNYTTPGMSRSDSVLHQKYVKSSESKERVLPDIFVNGAFNRVSGASSVESVVSRVSAEINSVYREKNYFTIEPLISKYSDLSYDVSCLVAGLGGRSLNDVKIKFIVVYDNGEMLGKRVAIELDCDNEIDYVEAGSFKEVNIGSFQFVQPPDAFYLSLTSKNDLETYQSIKWDVK